MESEEHLNDREELILNAVVQVYVTTAEPVGSRSIVKRLGLDLSPATVRNVMADLEDAGYLQQLHTSSGRVPTDKGYRYYVDYLMRVQELTQAERHRIEQELSERLTDVDEIMRHTSHLLALVTHQAGMAETPTASSAEVKHIELVPVSASRMAVLIADTLGRVHTQTAALDPAVTPAHLSELAAFLNAQLEGVALDKLSGVVTARMHEFLDRQRRLAEHALRVLSVLPGTPSGRLYLEGTAQLIGQPEFRDVSKARDVFGLFEERDRLLEVLRATAAASPRSGSSVVIGLDTQEGGLRDLSVVTSPYRIGGKTVGRVGVLGPRRMHYSRLTGIVDYTASMLGRLLTRLAER